MRTISSFETSCTMRVLILAAAFLACTTAAPSGTFFGPISRIAYSTVAFPGAVPTISPGDLQAAEINAKVQVEQQAQAAADKARELAEQATEKQDEGIIEANDFTREREEESFWAAEEQKWQALEALKTAEAQIAGTIASRASNVASAAYSIPTVIPAQTGLSEHSVVAADTKSIEPEGAKVEEQKENAEGEVMAAVKSVQAESKPENAEKLVDNAQAEAAKMESSASVENAEAVKEENPATAVQAESKQENAEQPVENVQAEAAKMESSASVKTAKAVREENLAAVLLAQTHPAPVVSNAFSAQPWIKQRFAPISYISRLQTYVPNLIPNYNGQLVNRVIFRGAW